jgi:FKBP-type peptidyl-prolyl cis-trans isomerase
MISRWLAALLIAAPASIASLAYAQDKPAPAAAAAPTQATSALPAISPIPADINARFSYAYGVMLGKQIAKQVDFDAKQFSTGIEEGAKGKADVSQAKADVLEVKVVLARLDKDIAKAQAAKDTELATIGREQRKMAVAELVRRESALAFLTKAKPVPTTAPALDSELYRPVEGFNIQLTAGQMEYDAQGYVTAAVNPQVACAGRRIELADGKVSQGWVQTKEFGKIRFIKKPDAKETTALVTAQQNADLKLALEQKPETLDPATAKVDIPDDVNAQFSYVMGALLGINIASEVSIEPDQVVKGLNDAAKGSVTLSNAESGILEMQWLMSRLDKDIAKAELAKDTGQLTMAQEQRKLAQLELARREQSAVQAKLGEEFLKKNKTAEGVKTTESGLQYKVIKEGAGPKPKLTDTFTAHYKGSLVTGQVFDQSKPDSPLILDINKVIPGWTEGLQLMPAGSKYMFWIPSELGYGEMGSPPTIPSNAVLVFEVELLKSEATASRPGPGMGQGQGNAGAQAKIGEEFLAKNKTSEGVKTTASGLQYKVLKEGKGPKPGATDNVTVNYKGSLLSGDVFDQSRSPVTFGLNQVIPGWTEGVQLMPVGSKFQFWIPSKLGYGDGGSPPQIPGGATLVFEVELIDAKPAR